MTKSVLAKPAYITEEPIPVEEVEVEIKESAKPANKTEQPIPEEKVENEEEKVENDEEEKVENAMDNKKRTFDKESKFVTDVVKKVESRK